MSAEENTRIAQSAYEALGRGDMAAIAEVTADDIEWVIPAIPTTTRTLERSRARKPSWAGFGGLGSNLEFTTFEPRELIAQNDKVVSLAYAEATVRNTGRVVVNHEAYVWTFRDGKLARFQNYFDAAAAAAAHRVE